MDDEPKVYNAVESPIEARLIGGFEVLSARGTVQLRLLAKADRAAEVADIRDGKYSGFWLHVFLQEQIGPYRVDFLVIASNGNDRFGIVVECDGENFHRNVRKDIDRDLGLGKLGFAVLRFTGSEIWADAVKCAERVLDTVAGNLGAPWHGSGLASRSSYHGGVRPFGQVLKGSIETAYWNYVGNSIQVPSEGEGEDYE